MKYLISVGIVIMLGLLPLSARTLRIEAKELSNNLNNYKILDTRLPEKYSAGHIKGALNMPITLTYDHQKIDGKLTNPIKMQKIIRELGLNVDSNVVIYDDGTFFDAARLFWALEVYGFKNVKLLNTGYDTWALEHYKVSTTTPKVTPSKYIAEVNNKRLATKFITQIATKNPNQIIIDARANEAYVGKKSSANRFGHIPKAVGIPATHNINYSTKTSKLKSIKNLKELYNNIDKKKKVIIYCAIGRISATNYFALRELDYDVSNYDASWKEWGNDFSLPIINPSKN